MSVRTPGVLVALLASLVLLAAAPGAEADPEVAAEIVRLQAALGASAAQQRQCLAAAVPMKWAGPAAEDMRLLKERAKQSNGEVWRMLLQKAEELETRAQESAASGGDLLTAQHVGLGCLERGAGEREALRAALELALTDPAAYKASLRDARENGSLSLRRDLVALRRQCLELAARIRARAAYEELAPLAGPLRARMAAMRQQHAVALLAESNRELAYPVLRAGEALVATFDAWEQERSARTAQERDEAARLRLLRWGSAERWLNESTARRVE